ncbi:Glyoxylase, beta-lactamase superfamily II [Halopenitus malekzadehii]|uniref:Glyoxylase, beta-lactamase superfamily II n=1 Tax=Halopenitus malekzadehii TaxID=1267564 RepID=A0A1H6IFS1_9EURY|nr:MBL fold metallo-hydrolase [Halopenitus malekzadehii]SEH45301.1 Glyoxylase, beta-lactamase superfamily II [Halopenitus malekzadehii]
MTADVVRIGFGAGSPEGANSAYLLPERGVLIDPGPPGEAAFETLLSAIDDTGLALEDLEHVLVTHWHVDHAGSAPRIADAADATLWMGSDDAPLVREYATARDRRLDRDAAALRDWGVPDETVEAVVDGDTPSPMPDRTPVSDLHDGDVIAGLEVIDTSGHTRGHVAFHDRIADQGDHESDTYGGETRERDDDRSALFVGDAVLATYTPNVGGGDTRLEDPLSTYRRTLDRLDDRYDPETTTAYPGHGTPLDLDDRIGTIRDHHGERRGNVRDALTERSPDPATPWEIAEDLFGELYGIHAKMGAGEAASHLTDLVATGDARLVDEEPLRYVIDESAE